MKILLDECIPKGIKSHLSTDGHLCTTVPEAGLAGKTNGELLRLAESNYDAFVTLDKGLQYQQNLANCKIAIVLIRSKSSRLADILPHIPACLAILRSIKSGEIKQVGQGK